MSNCQEFCPLKIECQGYQEIIDNERLFLDAKHQKLRELNQNYQRILDAADQNLLSGDITSEQHGQLYGRVNQQFEDRFGTTIDRFTLERTATLETYYQECSKAESKVKIITDLQEQCSTTCKGPKLPPKIVLSKKITLIFSAFSRQKIKAKDTKNNREKFDDYQAHKTHEDNLTAYGKCASESIILKKANITKLNKL